MKAFSLPTEQGDDLHNAGRPREDESLLMGRNTSSEESLFETGCAPSARGSGVSLLSNADPRILVLTPGAPNHLHSIRAGEKAEGYPIATIKAAAVWLMNLMRQLE